MIKDCAALKKFDIIDINMGCPVPKVVGNGEGSALMKEPKLVREIVSAVAKAVRKPVTVKIRKGFNDTCVNAVEIAQIAEDSGAAAVVVHGRTREQYYAGEADWEIIARVKDKLSIPVIGNGDITDGASAEAILEQTGCDGVMVGRAARGNPWIFRQVAAYLQDGTVLPGPEKAKIKETILRHARLQLDCKGEYTGIREMRKHAGWYVNGCRNAAKLRGKINEAESYAELLALFEETLSYTE